MISFEIRFAGFSNEGEEVSGNGFAIPGDFTARSARWKTALRFLQRGFGPLRALAPAFGGDSHTWLP